MHTQTHNNHTQAPHGKDTPNNFKQSVGISYTRQELAGSAECSGLRFPLRGIVYGPRDGEAGFELYV